MHHQDWNQWEHEQSKMRREFNKQKQRAEIMKSFTRRERRESLYQWAASVALCIAVVGFVCLIVRIS